MIILGIDPGLAIVGYGIIEYKGNKYKPIDYGCITTDADLDLPERLKIIYEELSTLIDKYNPDDVAMEELFLIKMLKRRLKWDRQEEWKF